MAFGCRMFTFLSIDLNFLTLSHFWDSHRTVSDTNNVKTRPPRFRFYFSVCSAFSSWAQAKEKAGSLRRTPRFSWLA